MATTKKTGNQLPLLAESTPWRLDERTRQIGLQGVASAREALRQARSGHGAPTEHHHRRAA